MGWTLVYMVLILKIPLAAALWLIWYAVKEEPQVDEGLADEDRGPRRKPPSLPRWPRRGPAGGAQCEPAPCPLQSPAALGKPAPVHARRH